MRKERMRLTSVVFYLNQAGKGDTGQHQAQSLEGLCVSWSYQVIRLEELAAKELLALENLPS
ncbi:MAG: hypothetical protein R2880_11605 [Deinococcales bacterium]